MHFGFPPQAGNTFQKCLAIGLYRPPQGFLRVEDGTEAEGKNRESPEALADNVSMVNNSLLGEGLARRVIADDHREFTARAGEYRSAVHASEVLNCKGTPSPAAV